MLDMTMSDDNPLTFYPPSLEELEKHKEMERMGLESRVYFDSICPHCGEKSEYTIQNTQMAMFSLTTFCGICPKCHKRYSVIDNIVKERPKQLIGCLTLIVIIVAIIILTSK